VHFPSSQSACIVSNIAFLITSESPTDWKLQLATNAALKRSYTLGAPATSFVSDFKTTFYNPANLTL
jgi:hypothetical protein